MCIIMNIKTQKITMEYNYYYLFLSLIMNILSNDYSTWNVTYSCMHEMKINLLKKYIILIIIMHMQQIGET